MKTSTAAIIICAFAFSSTSAFANSLHQVDTVPTDQVVEKLGLLMDIPGTPVGEIFDFSTKLT